MNNSPTFGSYQSAEAASDACTDVMLKMLDIYFGIRANQVSDDLVIALTSDIATKYKTLTVHDIEHAYSIAIINKTDWRNVNKNEAIAPIISWWQVKERIRLDFEKYQAEQFQDEADRESERAFKNKSIALYNKCVSDLEWTGTIYEASAVRKMVTQQIDKETKDELWIIAKETKQIMDNDDESKQLIPNNFGYSAKKIYSELIVKKGIELQIIIE